MAVTNYNPIEPPTEIICEIEKERGIQKATIAMEKILSCRR
jgi:hypothetical protein